MKESLIILLFAFMLDLYFGDPVYRLHPVRIIGNLISLMEKFLERIDLLTIKGGLLLVIIVQGIVLAVYSSLSVFFAGFALIFQIFVLYSCISLEDLVKHGKKVMIALEQDDLEKSQDAVQMLIGRDAKTLDEHGVARATVESLAENFVDGFLAPIFWFATGCILGDKIGVSPAFTGTAAVLFFKVTNTLDSMVGYKNERYLLFGRAAAKLDDGLNFLPARIGIPIISMAAILSRLNGVQAWRIGWRDRLKHSSPNAAHAEASVAGALNIRLNGPGIYPHGKVEKPWLGNGTELATPGHIRQASYLVLAAAFVSVALFAALMAL
jgi:adenosylcobinamide-phosphate synthase